jgi:hypothetical protein
MTCGGTAVPMETSFTDSGMKIPTEALQGLGRLRHGRSKTMNVPFWERFLIDVNIFRSILNCGAHVSAVVLDKI